MDTMTDAETIRYALAARELGVSVHELERRIDAAGVTPQLADGRRAILQVDLETLAVTPDPASGVR